MLGKLAERRAIVPAWQAVDKAWGRSQPGAFCHCRAKTPINAARGDAPDRD
jgi:hypothetical protein